MNISIFNATKPLTNVVKQLLKIIDVKVTQSTIEDTLLSHPDYPSLLAISDSLKRWKVDNAALRVNVETLKELPRPILAHINNEFKVITNVESDYIHYLNDDGSKVKSDLKIFQSLWNGIVLLVEADQNAGEKNFLIKKKKENNRRLFVPLLLLIAFVNIVLSTLSISHYFGFNTALGYFGLLNAKLVGILISCLLLWYEIDKYNPAIQRFCGGNNKKTNCNAILNSSSSKIFSWLSWSEVGFIYFTSSLLIVLINSSFTNIVSWLNIFTLPYIFFSIFYQWKIAKQWCPLCLTVQAVLFGEFLISYSFNLYIIPQNVINLNTLTPLAILFLKFFVFTFLIACLWFFMKSRFVAEQEGINNKYELSRLKNNFDIFSSILKEQKSLIQDSNGLGIVLGNRSAKNTVIKVCNPYCDPCSKAHPAMEELMNEDLKVQIIYNASNMEYDITRHPVKHFLAISELEDEDKMKKALHDWYSDNDKNYDLFAKNNPIKIDENTHSEKVNAMHTWCAINNVTFTPTYFFNGKQLPSSYKLSDIKNLVN